MNTCMQLEISNMQAVTLTSLSGNIYDDSFDSKHLSTFKLDNFVKSKFAVILNEARMKNLLQLSTRFFVATPPQTMSGFRRKDSFEPFYDSIKLREHKWKTKTK